MRVRRVTIPGRGMAGAHAINQTFTHHFLAILTHLLGEILLPTKWKTILPSLELFL